MSLQKTDSSNQKMVKKGDKQIFPTDRDGNIIPGTYQTAVGEVKIKKIEPAKHYDVISLARAMNDDFAAKTKQLFGPEVQAVREAMATGVYISWRPIEKPWDQQDCQRVCSTARCFCGHLLNQHEQFTGKQSGLKCTQIPCGCQAFKFIPSRPEEVGEFWLPKRRDFNPATYRVKCKCKHTHEEHVPEPSPYRCRASGCGCQGFMSSFMCAACDKSWQEHQTVIETEAERKQEGRQVGEAWMPFSELPELSKIALTGEDNPNVQTLADALPPGARHGALPPKRANPALSGPSAPH
ncbi:unnamed protein product [Calicophoron daubneyi]|uniref:Protein FAM221B n=1 Tax=Calicophoron daubneyi TaxID=300641 RepID=A0AAV2TLM4_CALDB